MNCYICKAKRNKCKSDKRESNKNNEVIIECHKCSSFFHEQCLQWWLNKAARCPNCKEFETNKFVYHINN